LNNDILNLLNKSKTPGLCGFPLANPHSGESLYFVPDENIGKDIGELCIRRGILKFLDDEIVDANLKKQTPKFVTVITVILRYAGSVGADF
jgi:hypothetical protein